MPTVDLSPLFPDALRLKDHTGREWVIPPPTKADGVLLAALNAQGVALNVPGATCTGCGRPLEGSISPKFQTALEHAGDRELGEVSLTKIVYDQMVEADVPGPYIDRMALYAMYFWAVGKEYADAMLKALTEHEAGKEVHPDPKAPRAATPRRSKNGRSTASANRTSTASTSGTAHPAE